MSISNDIELYLPKYLSAESTKELLKEIGDFPNNSNGSLYTSYLSGVDKIFQGDGVCDLLVINLPETKVASVPSIVLSNTCDIDLDNPRELPMQITYSPIFNLEKYRKLLESQDKSPEYVRQHIDIIKRQGITQILYLPEGGNLKYDGIVFLDRINNCSNNAISRDNLRERRLFTLSNYGLYLFLLKISIHFSRIQEKIDRNTGVII